MVGVVQRLETLCRREAAESAKGSSGEAFPVQEPLPELRTWANSRQLQLANLVRWREQSAKGGAKERRENEIHITR